jgi:DNA mismatch repair protein MSH6
MRLTFQSNQAKKPISYAESDDEEDAFDPAGISTQRRKVQRKVVVEDDDDDDDAFIGGLDGADDDGM